jgi:hypothetical protein
LKKFVLILISCFSCIFASAQYNFYKLSVGAGAGAGMAFGDLPKNFIRPAGVINFDYHFTPHSSLGLELQKGFLSGGDSVDTDIDIHHRFYKNSFSALSLNGKIELAQFVDLRRGDLLYAVRGFYIGTGIGVINSKMTEIKRTKLQDEVQANGEIKKVPYTFPGVSRGMDLLVPINTGINFHFEDKWGFTKYALNFNYQMNMVLGEKIDGYDDPPSIFKNKHGDYYGVATIGFKFFFGPEGLY